MGVYYIIVSGFVYNLQFLKVPPGVCGGPGCRWVTRGRIATSFSEQGSGADLGDTRSCLSLFTSHGRSGPCGVAVTSTQAQIERVTFLASR